MTYLIQFAELILYSYDSSIKLLTIKSIYFSLRSVEWKHVFPVPLIKILCLRETVLHRG